MSLFDAGEFGFAARCRCLSWLGEVVLYFLMMDFYFLASSRRLRTELFGFAYVIQLHFLVGGQFGVVQVLVKFTLFGFVICLFATVILVLFLVGRALDDFGMVRGDGQSKF